MPHPAPVLYLDIDGVLLPGRMHASPTNTAARAGLTPDLPWSHLLGGIGRRCASECCPRMIETLNGLTERTGARLVLISTWRDAIGVAETLEILRIQGLADAWHADPAAPWTGDKGGDIAAWRSAHPGHEVWAVIDDDEIAGDTWRQVRPELEAGPSDADWRRLERLLSAEGAAAAHAAWLDDFEAHMAQPTPEEEAFFAARRRKRS